VSNPARVLVVFYSRCGNTEKLALAAAVGAVQARANIRLRRLPDVTDKPECAEETFRMKREYVNPAEADVLWADSIIFILPPELGPSSPECTVYLDLLRQLNIDRGRTPVRLTDTVEATKHGRLSARS
jgi:NAD(P)H dehydrogenase (quinone)